MQNTRIFSDLPLDDSIQLERLLENLLIKMDGIAGRKAILINAGIDNYFIGSIDFNLKTNEFSTILVGSANYSHNRNTKNTCAQC